jgi:Zn-dependent protease
MPTRHTIQLARISGIRIGVGVSWFVVLFLYIFVFFGLIHETMSGSRTTTYVVAVASVLAFFASLVAHELGHALVARRNGLQVLGIELWALGGVTRTVGTPRDAGAEFRVAAAGPAVTFSVIAASVVAVEVLLRGQRLATEIQAGHVTPAVMWLILVAGVNGLVLIVNLLPAYPLDGAQITHAILWRLTGDRNAAARLTGRIGQGCALALGLLGVLVVGRVEPFVGIMVLILATFLYQNGGRAVLQGAMGQRIQRLTVADIMDREPEVIPSELRLLDAHEQFFERYRRPWFAVVDSARHFLGVVRSERLDAELAAGRPALSVGEVLEGDSEPPMRIDEDEPLESVLRSEALGRWGGVVAVDDDGILRGVVTLAQIRKALRVASGQ